MPDPAVDNAKPEPLMELFKVKVSVKVLVPIVLLAARVINPVASAVPVPTSAPLVALTPVTPVPPKVMALEGDMPFKIRAPPLFTVMAPLPNAPLEVCPVRVVALLTTVPPE